MDAPGKKDAQGGDVLNNEQAGQLFLPQDGRIERPDMAAAFASLEDERACALLEEHIKQARCGHMQERLDTLLFKGFCLSGASSGNQDNGRFGCQDKAGLLFQHLGIGKAQNADAPCLISHRFSRLCQGLLGGGAGHHSHRKEGQGSTVGDGAGERGHVADSRHGTLGQRIGGPQLGCHSTARSQ